MSASVDKLKVSVDVGGSGKGYVAMGTSGYFPAEFDDFKLSKGQYSIMKIMDSMCLIVIHVH